MQQVADRSLGDVGPRLLEGLAEKCGCCWAWAHLPTLPLSLSKERLPQDQIRPDVLLLEELCWKPIILFPQNRIWLVIRLFKNIFLIQNEILTHYSSYLVSMCMAEAETDSVTNHMFQFLLTSFQVERVTTL